MTKDELTIELAMRFTVALRVPTLFSGKTFTSSLGSGNYDDNERYMDAKIARFVLAMSRNFVEEFHRGAAERPKFPDAPASTELSWHEEAAADLVKLRPPPAKPREDLEAP